MKVKTFWIFILSALVAFPLAAQPVEVKIVDRNGKNIGSAKLTQVRSGVRVQVRVSGLTPGRHGLHIHSAGACDPPAFKTAGSHFSPENHSHGFLDAKGPHAGDLPVLNADSKGKVSDYDFTTTRVSLSRDSLLHPQGTSLVIHAKPDDYLTDTGGGSGDRIACGVISSGSDQAAATQGSGSRDQQAETTFRDTAAR